MENVLDIVRQQAEETLVRLGAQDIIKAEQVAESVLRQAAYWEKPINEREKLLFVRLFSPVVQREEVFLGNILLNAFLSKTFARAVAEGKFGTAEAIANDLENYYFLVRAASDVAQLMDAFRAEVEPSLPDLFFSEQEEKKGIYGDLTRMFTFRKSDFEPFPVYAVPKFLAPQLEKAVRRELSKLLAPTVFPEHVRTVLATIAFFYGRTSGGKGDAQSPSNFIDHLVREKDYDRLLKSADVKRAFNVKTVNKTAIKQSIDDGTFSGQKLRSLLSELTQSVHASIDGGETKWLLGFLHKDKKFMDLPAADYVREVLAYVQIGCIASSQGERSTAESLRCTVCGSLVSQAKSSMSLMGVAAFERHNQSVRQPEKDTPRVCARCALYSYLGQKLLGTESRSIGGTPPKFAQVPKGYNLVFHYGKHDEQEVERLTRAIDLTWNLLRHNQGVVRIRRELFELEEKLQKETRPAKQKNLRQQIVEKRNEVHITQSAADTTGRDLFDLYPWLKDWEGLQASYETPSLDVLSHLQLSETKTERHILGLGMGGYRMVLFVLPQIRPPRDVAHDFGQRRFSDSRVTVTALLSFLRELCGCDGPFYYQSLPTLQPTAFQRDTFYIRNEPISVKQAQSEYEAVTQLAWKLVKKRGSDGFVEKIVLAEKILAEPLVTFSEILRNSPVLGRREGKYKPLSREVYRPRVDWQAQDLTDYLVAIEKLRKMEVK